MTPVFWIAWSGAIFSMRMRSCRHHVGRVEEGPTINRSQLRLRLHRQLAGRLEVFNAAIRSLQVDGTLARIVARYAPKAHVVGLVEIR